MLKLLVYTSIVSNISQDENHDIRYTFIINIRYSLIDEIKFPLFGLNVYLVVPNASNSSLTFRNH